MISQQVSAYARMWPREIFDCVIPNGNGNRKQALAKSLEFLKGPGVYVLYRDDVPYYVGQSQRLRRRIWRHANKPGSRYYNHWNFFSAFVVKNSKSRNEIEGILIAAMPTANSAQPKLKKEKLPKSVMDMMRRIRHDRANPLSEPEMFEIVEAASN